MNIKTLFFFQFSADTLVLEVEVAHIKGHSDYVMVNFVLYGVLQHGHKIELNKNYYFEVRQDVDINGKVIFNVKCEEVKDKMDEWQHDPDPEIVFSNEVEDYKESKNIKVFASKPENPAFDGFGMLSNLKWHIVKG